MSMNVNSPLVDREIIQNVLSTAMSNGGEWAEVFVEDRQSGAAEYDENRVEAMVSSRDLGAGIRVTVGDATGFAHTSDISPTGLNEAAQAAAAAARGGAQITVNCVATGDQGMQTGRETVGYTVGFELFDDHDVESMAQRAARRAITKLAARPAPSGQLPVVIERGGGGVLFHEACGHGLEADLVNKGASVFRDRIGELVAAPSVTLVDDGTMGVEWGTIAIDDEGCPTQKNVLIEDGVLTDYMWDHLRSRSAGRPASGNGRRQSYQHLPMVRMTNTYVTNGDVEPQDIISDTQNGIYVAQLGGGQVNTATCDFVFGMTEAYLIENGEITAPLREGNLIGNGPDVLQNIEVAGNDFAMGSPGTCGKDGQGVPVGDGQPTLRVAALTIGGTAS